MNVLMSSAGSILNLIARRSAHSKHLRRDRRGILRSPNFGRLWCTNSTNIPTNGAQTINIPTNAFLGIQNIQYRGALYFDEAHNHISVMNVLMSPAGLILNLIARRSAHRKHLRRDRHGILRPPYFGRPGAQTTQIYLEMHL